METFAVLRLGTVALGCKLALENQIECHPYRGGLAIPLRRIDAASWAIPKAIADRKDLVLHVECEERLYRGPGSKACDVVGHGDDGRPMIPARVLTELGLSIAVFRAQSLVVAMAAYGRPPADDATPPVEVVIWRWRGRRDGLIASMEHEHIYIGDPRLAPKPWTDMAAVAMSKFTDWVNKPCWVAAPRRKPVPAGRS